MTSTFLFVVPGAYLVASRLKTWPERISWILINPTVIAVLSLTAGTATPPGKAIVAFVLYWLSWQSIYETGYLANDVLTIRSEESPTFRFDEETLGALDGALPLLMALKLIVSVILLAGVALTHVGAPARFVVLLVIVRVVFALHNRLRSRWNVGTYFTLSVLKYAAIPVSFVVTSEMAALVTASVLLFPVPRTIEHATKIKYGYPRLRRWVQPVWRFRVVYYLWLTAGFTVVAINVDGRTALVGCMLSLFLLLVRIGAALLERRAPREVFPAYRSSAD